MTDRRDKRIAELEAVVAKQVALIEELQAKVARLKEQLGKNSSNSSLPPSTDRGRNPNRNKKKASRRKRKGAQKGHKGHKRELLPPERVDEAFDYFPPECDGCGARLAEEPCAEPRLHQTVEIPEIRAHVTEHRMHSAKCGCGHVTQAALPDEIGQRVFGPRLVALVSLLTGYYRLSKRRCRDLLSTVMDIEVSLGAVSRMEAEMTGALGPSHDEAWAAARDAPVGYVDETSWRQENQTHWLWVMVTAAATVFLIRRNRNRDCAEELLGNFAGTMVSDRLPTYDFWDGLRQVCWAHLIRLFRAFAEASEGTFKHTVGHRLLKAVGELFEQWHRYRDGRIGRSTLRRRLAPVRREILAALAEGRDSGDLELGRKCDSILKHATSLFTFLDHDGVEPTNNFAERALRHAVILRKLSFGTQSDRGSRFLERIFTVVETSRACGRDLFAFLHASIDAARQHTAPPSLLSS